MTMGCVRLECSYLDAKHFIHKANAMDQAKAPKSLVCRKKNEDLIQGCTSKENKTGHGGKVASFLLLYHLVKVFAIVSIRRNFVVNYLLNLRKTTLLRFSKIAMTSKLQRC